MIMGKAKVLDKTRVTATTAPGRKDHRFQVFGGNGKLITASPPHQHYYNEPEMQTAKVIAGKALVYDRRETIHAEMIPVFKQYCADNNQGQDTLDTLHLAMDLLLKNFGDA
jgi:hypothetical protein